LTDSFSSYSFLFRVGIFVGRAFSVQSKRVRGTQGEFTEKIMNALTPTQSEAALESLPVEKLMSAYSGALGCACGCRGRYRYTSAHREAAGATRGYPIMDKDVSDRGAARILRTARLAVKAGARVDAYTNSEGQVVHLVVATDNKNYIFGFSAS
jgi:hypothetical protein